MRSFLYIDFFQTIYQWLRNNRTWIQLKALHALPDLWFLEKKHVDLFKSSRVQISSQGVVI